VALQSLVEPPHNSIERTDISDMEKHVPKAHQNEKVAHSCRDLFDRQHKSVNKPTQRSGYKYVSVIAYIQIRFARTMLRSRRKNTETTENIAAVAQLHGPAHL